MYSARILDDSINIKGNRLVTMELTYPRIIHSELMTHRMFSRNSSSSRAIPIEKMIDSVRNDPFIPIYWGKNQSGMQAHEELIGKEQEYVRSQWINTRDYSIIVVQNLVKGKLHKQISNRLLEPWMWITVIVSATEWENFFLLRQDSNIPITTNELRLRVNPDFPAQPEIQVIAHMARQLYYTHTPILLHDNQWHLPLVKNVDLDNLIEYGYSDDELVKISVGRCARVSYLTHDGKRDPQADIALHDRLILDRHWSPFEHVAQADSSIARSGNFQGFRQYRKRFLSESGTNIGG